MKNSSTDLRVLVLDDDPSICKMLTKLLVHLNFDVVCTIQGEDTVNEYIKAKEAGTTFDIIILDLIIPGYMGGEEVFRLIKGLDPDVMAIVSSAYSSNPVMSNYLQHGFSAVLPKPYNLHQLKHLVAEVIQM